jgi:hypothetical protein
MLLVKKFTKIKKLSWYRFLYGIRVNTDQNTNYIRNAIKNYVHIFTSHCNFKQGCYIRNVILKSSVFDYKDDSLDYCIRKEIITNTLMLTCDDLVVLHIDKSDRDRFCLLYKDSTRYKFRIYEYVTGYIVFCVSHKKHELDTDIISFQINNFCKIRSILFSYFINNKLHYLNTNSDFFGSSVVILNNNIHNTPQGLHNKDFYNNTYKFYKTIGFGKQNHILYLFVDIIMNYVTVFKTYPISLLHV